MKPRAKSFDIKSDAEKWARNLETELDRCGSAFPDTRLAEKMTLRELLEKYLVEITLHKRSARSETFRARALMKRDNAYRTLAIMLTANDVAVYRNDRLKAVSSATVLKELNLIGHAIDIARKEWSVHLPLNPCRMIRRPVAPKGRDRRLENGEEQSLLDAADRGRNLICGH